MECVRAEIYCCFHLSLTARSTSQLIPKPGQKKKQNHNKSQKKKIKTIWKTKCRNAVPYHSRRMNTREWIEKKPEMPAAEINASSEFLCIFLPSFTNFFLSILYSDRCCRLTAMQRWMDGRRATWRNLPHPNVFILSETAATTMALYLYIYISSLIQGCYCFACHFRFIAFRVDFDGFWT